MPRKRKTDAQRARELSAKGLTPPEIARKLEVPRQNVHDALSRTRNHPGRPRVDTVRHSVRIPSALEAWLHSYARQTGRTIEAVIVALLDAAHDRGRRVTVREK